MGKDKRVSRFVLVVIGLVLTLGFSIFGSYLMLGRSVQAQFGEPSANLSMTQRIIFPVELFINQDALINPLDITGGAQPFSIDPGESVAMICYRLEQAGMISDAELMRIYLVYTGLDRSLKSGQFMLSADMSPVQIASELLDATPREAVVTILPGWRIEEVAANVAGSGLSITAEAFINAAYAPSSDVRAILPVEDLRTLEGFLFPGSYVLQREAGLNELLALILGTFSSQVDNSLMEGFNRQGLTLAEAVNLASIVEKESVVAEEKPLIASVLLNRLAVGMRLETDPTVQYGLGFDPAWGTWWKSPLAIADLSIDSPYNTYQNFGLPPGPISNPDLGSLRAVAFPAETPYYFFRAACDGSGRHNFAITFEEHLNNACE